MLDSADDTIVKCDLNNSADDTIVKRPTTPILNLTKSKSCEDLQQITSTPIRAHVSNAIFGKSNHIKNSPKHRVMQHSKMMDSKLEGIHTSLSTMDITMKHFVEKLNDINLATMKTPDALSARISEMLNNHKTKVTESLSTIEAKIKHCATGIDSLQTKANVADNLVKDLKANQVEHKITIDKMSTLIVKLVDRIESLQHCIIMNPHKIVESDADITLRPTTDNDKNLFSKSVCVEKSQIKAKANKDILSSSHLFSGKILLTLYLSS